MMCLDFVFLVLLVDTSATSAVSPLVGQRVSITSVNLPSLVPDEYAFKLSGLGCTSLSLDGLVPQLISNSNVFVLTSVDLRGCNATILAALTYKQGTGVPTPVATIGTVFVVVVGCCLLLVVVIFLFLCWLKLIRT